MKKDYIIYPLLGIAVGLLIIFTYNHYKNSGGGFTIESIEKLGQPYICTFEKSDGTSEISGTIHVNGPRLYGEFKITTSLAKNEFESFLLEKGGLSYVWTSLQNTGYKSAIAQSANVNATPEEQAQIIGLRDKLPYDCQLWQNADNSLFEVPVGIIIF